MRDECVSAAIRSEGLELAVAITTELVRNAQRAHGLAATSIIALGRLLTAAALVELSSKKRHGSTSLQVLSTSRIRQIYADVNQEGNARGFARNADLAFPVMEGETTGGRRKVSLAVLPGKLHVISAHENGHYTHSTTDLVTGEIDTDVEHFLEQSDQIPTMLLSEVLLGVKDEVEVAGGVLVQALPGGHLERLDLIRASLGNEGLAGLLRAKPAGAVELLRAVASDAVVVEHPHPVAWKCRCSRARVLRILEAMGPADIAEMVASGEPALVSCDLCGSKFTIEPAEIEKILGANIKAQG